MSTYQRFGLNGVGDNMCQTAFYVLPEDQNQTRFPVAQLVRPYCGLRWLSNICFAFGSTMVQTYLDNIAHSLFKDLLDPSPAGKGTHITARGVSGLRKSLARNSELEESESRFPSKSNQTCLRTPLDSLSIVVRLSSAHRTFSSLIVE